MTEEIIDGVDVSGCKLRTENNEMACFVICKEYPDCYYKQLKRLEIEDKEVAKNIICKNGTIAGLAKIRYELNKENVKLKETLKSVRGYFIVLENIIPTEMLAEGSGVSGAINDAKKEIDEVLKDE